MCLMKGLIAGIVLIIVLGLGAFFYRNMFEHPTIPEGGTACTADAKICPDGSGVGRTGPNCTFAPCPPPNYEVSSLGVSFIAPSGYVENLVAKGDDTTLVSVFDKSSKGEVPHTILLRVFPFENGGATSTILAHTMYESSGEMAKSLKEFTQKAIGSHLFYCVTLERFEGQIHTACYLPRANDVLRFEVLEKDVDWTNPALKVDSLPEHQAFYKILSTLQGV